MPYLLYRMFQKVILAISSKKRFNISIESVNIAYAKYLFAVLLNKGDFNIIALKIIP